nr:tetratricopeptide repeat protein [Alphaproteobacteria bacterium]
AQAPVQTAAVVPAAPVQSDPMPQFDANSPSRVLSPPISIRRAEAEFSGLGNAVQVREVSQSAQDNVTAGYNALVRGDVGSALQLYSDALSSEPTSVMAQLGRSAALQRLGRLEEARTGYESVLRIDPNNREALANLTSIFSTRAPNEALSRLLDLEREYPQFSPVKAQVGLLYARMGSNDQAMAYLREAASMSPATVMYQYNLAVLLDRMGRAEQAVVSYERVLAGILNGGVASDLSRSSIERRVRYLKTL